MDTIGQDQECQARLHIPESIRPLRLKLAQTKQPGELLNKLKSVPF